ncbi:DUF6456 domain-containing protein [Antarcticimicrobium sediminis]|uniref:Helix-turn-helix domain-containing protein n=1 Tax=Antarcticimicrobium sediminis TaxID=2546227 RepID=A0A4R5EUK1_9RHOB|nr:DUF6456 domain-containing protein [Antarcticimicrobium sediminis]TDE38377.1 helix-turn-helix domain-containing protein [Antarcticimicrobium sediminis]
MHMPFAAVPFRVPITAHRYLLHTVAGRPIRALARSAGCHASTVLRQIHRVETRRDDPLVDAALAALARAYSPPAPDLIGRAPAQDHAAMPQQPQSPETASFERQALIVLRRLSDPAAVLAVAEQMEKAVVVRGDAAGESTRTAVVDVEIAKAMALNDWIACETPGRVSRYRITAAGRAELRRRLAEAENRARARSDDGFSEAQTPFGASGARPDTAGEGGARRARYCRAESPITLLARRKDRDGLPFLEEGLVRAGERLREDFELAQIGPRTTQNWDRFLTGGHRDGTAGTAPYGPGAARDRVARALADLGPGLSDVALRCCCYMEGLEQAEKRLGWSARSGKIVLRIALQRLSAYYEQDSADTLVG